MQTNPSASPIDIATLYEMVGDDPELIAELIEIYLEDGPAYLGEMEGAISTADADKLYGVAHTLKGSSSSMGASQMAQICAALEHLGRSGTTEGSAALLAQAQAEFGRIQSALAQYAVG